MKRKMNPILLQGSEELFSVEPLAPNGSRSSVRRSAGLLSSSLGNESVQPLGTQARPPPQIDMDEEMAESKCMYKPVC